MKRKWRSMGEEMKEHGRGNGGALKRKWMHEKRENITYSMHGRIIQSNRKIKIRGKKIIFLNT
ncbi:MAG: hypothetical protein MR463_00045 [Bacteroidales bacterium]|nr:hypothetical protein [Bacteroidales bacterium]